MMDNINIRLPFDFTLIGLITTETRRTFIAWERAGAAHNYGTHELFSSGACEHGHYMASQAEAIADLVQRAGLAKE